MGPDPSEDRDVVVTYKRILPQNEPVRSGRPAMAAGGRRESILDAAELRPVDPIIGDPIADGDLAGAGGLGDLRADRSGIAADFTEDASRPDWVRYGLIGAALALVAGVGILAATVGIATISPETRQGVAVNGDEPASEPASVAIREIPMSPEVAPQEAAPQTGLPVLAPPPVAVAPPIPRARPDGVAAAPAAVPEPANPRAASVSPAPSLPASSSPASSANSAPSEIVRIESTPTAKPTPTLAAPIFILPAPMPQAAAAPKSAAPDGLIVSIEEALAKIDATAPAAPNGVGSGSALPPVLPPPQAAAPQAVPAQQSYPTYGSNAGPYYDVVPPPPAAGNGYSSGAYSNGPVPPEPVPQSYPQGAYPQGPYQPGAYPQTPGVYQPDPYAYPPAAVEEAEVRKPGIVRRTIAKAGDAVGRVFSKD